MAAPPGVGPRVGDYVLTSVLGAGSFATVYRGVHAVTGEEVAVKAVRLASLPPGAVRALEAEVRLQASLPRHAHVVHCAAVLRSQRFIFLVLELARGGDVARYVRAHGALSEGEAAALGAALARGLAHLRAHAISHRDIKPSNLLLTGGDTLATSRVLIADFGFARVLAGGATAHTQCGSPLYMAPEVMAGHTYGAGADLWSVGATLADVLRGSPPFTGTSAADLLANIRRAGWVHGSAADAAARSDGGACGGVLPPALAATASPALKHLLTGLLRADPAARMSFDAFFAHPWVNEGVARGGGGRSVSFSAALGSGSDGASLPPVHSRSVSAGTAPALAQADAACSSGLAFGFPPPAPQAAAPRVLREEAQHEAGDFIVVVDEAAFESAAAGWDRRGGGDGGGAKAAAGAAPRRHNLIRDATPTWGYEASLQAGTHVLQFGGDGGVGGPPLPTTLAELDAMLVALARAVGSGGGADV